MELADRLAGLNALLNATSFVLLCVGYYFIRTRADPTAQANDADGVLR